MTGTPVLPGRPEHAVARPGPAGKELADGHGELAGVQHAIAVQVEPVEGSGGLVRVRTVDRGQVSVLVLGPFAAGAPRTR